MSDVIAEARRCLASPDTVPKRRLVVVLNQLMNELESLQTPDAKPERVNPLLSSVESAFWPCGHLRGEGETGCWRPH